MVEIIDASWIRFSVLGMRGDRDEAEVWAVHWGRPQLRYEST